ncbi:hypothetical protein FSP39_019663 [Pinctada imbricata]|uniref:Uncharacterized protein n=1 Tax=Pinctada imbricata TaxID=66713 RepID=A0AA89BQA4_PINIB|nr:hypothetical protein FSP39_019663 [Pinctada imbricata]
MDLLGFHASKASDQNLRLVGGNSTNEGRLEIKYVNIWGTICSDRFNISAANVACKQLGFAGAKSVKHFGAGSGQIWLDEVRCNGSEKNILDCKKNSFAAHDCTHNQDVGVVCKGCSQQEVKVKETRVIGGHEAVPGSWPWVASVQVKFPDDQWFHLCGATLIDTQWIITAAHCFDSSKKPSQYRIALGKHYVSAVEDKEQIVNISKIYIHPDYDIEQHPNDIALVKLKTPIRIDNANVNTICMPDSAERSLSNRDYCYVAGWGKTKDKDASEVLIQTRIPLMDNFRCRFMYKGLTNKMICGGYLFGGTDSCKGDSGGPLMCRRQGKWELGGVISWGEGCAQPMKPGVYTRTKPYLSWINSIMGKSPSISSKHHQTTTVRTTTRRSIFFAFG